MSCNGMMSFFPTNFMLLNSHEDHDHHHQTSMPLNPILPSCSPQDFHNVNSFIGTKRASMSFSGIDLCEETTGDQDDLSDEDGSQAGEKKRRLNMEQVKTLEKNFELGNKLEPERKIQLAKALGLQPRQIAIWFQNRRARWKTKQLEKDYEILKRQFDSVKADNDVLRAQNLRLHAEIMALKNREPTESINLNKETEGSCSNRSENTSDDHNIQLDISRAPPIDHSLDLSTGPITTTSLSCISTIVPNNDTGLSLTHHQLFQNSSRPDHFIQTHRHLDHHHHHHNQNVKEESFTNMFTGIEDQPGFWPWIEQHQFN